MIPIARIGFYTALALATTSPVLANDSVATVGAGGLVLERTDRITMASEDLTLSPGRVHVRYVFRNTAPKSLTTIVAFPLPVMSTEQEGDVSVDLNADDPMQFTVKVAGKPVKTKLERKRSKDGIKLTYYWTQTFPPAVPLIVEHSYSPGIGVFFLDPARDKKVHKTFCIEPDLARALNARVKKQKHDLVARHLKYILTTGNHWRGPIGRFRLTIDKGTPRILVSLCLNGLRKTGPTRFEFQRTDFRPERDLDLLFIDHDG